MEGWKDGLSLGLLPPTWGQGVCVSVCAGAASPWLASWAAVGLDGGLRDSKKARRRLTRSFLSWPSSPGGLGVERALGSGKTWGLGVDQPRVGRGRGKSSRESSREQRVPQRPLQHFAPALWPQRYLKWDKK